MNITRPDFDHAADAVLLHPEQARKLWEELARRATATAFADPTAFPSGSPVAPAARFDLAHLLYYFGALIVLGSMGWFMTSVWESFGGLGIFGIAAIYALLFILGARALLARPGTRTPGGLLVMLAVGMTPLAIYGLERGLGWWPDADPGRYADFHAWIKGGWVVMEFGTLAAGLLALWWVRFPFLTMPVAFALWYLSMDLAPLLSGSEYAAWHFRALVSLWFGVLMLGLAYFVDVRRRWQGPDYGFWLSLFGLLAFWGGLTSLRSESEWGGLLYGLLNVGLMLVGVLLDRRAFVVFGALGVNLYVGHLAWDLFRDSPLFPFVLSVFGLLIIVSGVLYQRRRAALRASLLAQIPAHWLGLVPRR